MIKLKVPDYLVIASAHGHRTYEQQAAASGLGVATIHRLRNGAPAGERAVAALCTTYGVEFDSLFAIAAPAAALSA